MDKYNCSAELWFGLVVTGDGLAILSGAIAIVMVVYLKLHLKFMYRLMLYQVLSAVLSSVMWMIYGFVIKLYKGDVCVPWVNIILCLAFFFAQLQLYLAASMAVYICLLTIVQAERLPMRTTQCIQGPKTKGTVDVVVVGPFFFICVTYSTALIFIPSDPWSGTCSTFNSFIFLIAVVAGACVIITIMVLPTCVLACRAKNEMRQQYKKLLCQELPLLTFPAMFIILLPGLLVALHYSDGLSPSSWKSIGATASMWCCISNIVLAIHISTILYIRRKATPRIVSPDTARQYTVCRWWCCINNIVQAIHRISKVTIRRKATPKIATPETVTERSPLHRSTTNNAKSGTYFSIQVED